MSVFLSVTKLPRSETVCIPIRCPNTWSGELDHDRVFELSHGLVPKLSRDYVVENPTSGRFLIPLLESPSLHFLKSLCLAEYQLTLQLNKYHHCKNWILYYAFFLNQHQVSLFLSRFLIGKAIWRNTALIIIVHIPLSRENVNNLT